MQLSLSLSNIYIIIYFIIFILFLVAFTSQPYFTATNGDIKLNVYYTNIVIEGYGEYEKHKVITKENNKTFIILMLSIIIFVLFGCSFLTLYLNSKKLNKIFNILILLSMITIIILFHELIYDESYGIKKGLDELVTMITGNHTKTKIKTTSTVGYALTMTSTILMFITIVSSFIFHK